MAKEILDAIYNAEEECKTKETEAKTEAQARIKDAEIKAQKFIDDAEAKAKEEADELVAQAEKNGEDNFEKAKAAASGKCEIITQSAKKNRQTVIKQSIDALLN